MTVGDPRVDSTGRLFFVSYAHPLTSAGGRDLSKEHRFYQDLCEDVGELRGRDAGAFPGYMDLTMKAGTAWSKELLAAVGRCQVFLPLLSMSQIGSEWCGKEWHAFARRTIEQRADAPSDHSPFGHAILPVRWTPMSMRSLPKVVGAIQIFAPTEASVARLYDKHGIYGLLIEEPLIYRKVVWELAREINLVLDSYHVIPRIPKAESSLVNVFKEPPT